LSWDIAGPLLNESFVNLKQSEPGVPIFVSAIDLESGQEVLLEGGNIVERLKVSLASPGILPPIEMGARKLVDSSLYCELPLGLISDDDRPVVAVDIPNAKHEPRLRSIIDVLSYADELRGQEIKRIMLDKADHVLTLRSPGSFHWGNYILAPRLVRQAYKETHGLLKQGKNRFNA
jgi:predicted acylesterase/phospholipase RssA